MVKRFTEKNEERERVGERKNRDQSEKDDLGRDRERERKEREPS